jgi:serine/threonine protein kinase
MKLGLRIEFIDDIHRILDISRDYMIKPPVKRAISIYEKQNGCYGTFIYKNPSKNGNEHSICFRSRLGDKDSKDGEVYSSALRYYNKSIDILAIKIVPLYSDRIKNEHEIPILHKLTILCKTKQTRFPNIPLLYGYCITQVDERTIYRNQHIINRIESFIDQNKLKVIRNDKNKLLKEYNKVYDAKYGGTCNVIIVEKCHGTLATLIKSGALNDKIMISIVAQILISLEYIHSTAKVLHLDLHLGNILYDYVPNNSYLTYHYKSKKYIIPTYGYIIKIWDYGNSIFMNTLKSPVIKSTIFDKFIVRNIRELDTSFMSSSKLVRTHEQKTLRSDYGLSAIDIMRFSHALWVYNSKYNKSKNWKSMKILTNIQSYTYRYMDKIAKNEQAGIKYGDMFLYERYVHEYIDKILPPFFTEYDYGYL